MNILFIDCETTGLDPSRNAMIEFAAELHSSGAKVAEFSTPMYDKKSPVTLGALRVNGKNLKQIYELKDEAVALMELVDWLLSLKVEGPVYVCGHNVHFDISFLRALFNKYNLEGLDQVIGYHFIDTSAIGIALVASGKLQVENNKVSLSSLAKALGIDISQYQLHTAGGDVKLTVDVYNAMVTLIKGA